LSSEIPRAGAADVTDLALSDQVIEGAESLLDRSDEIVGVYLIKVDVVCLKSLEAGFDGVHDVPAGGPDVVPSRTCSGVDLGREDDILAGDVEILEGLA
jgi:hypothetical protein